MEFNLVEETETIEYGDGAFFGAAAATIVVGVLLCD